MSGGASGGVPPPVNEQAAGRMPEKRALLRRIAAVTDEKGQGPGQSRIMSPTVSAGLGDVDLERLGRSGLDPEPG
jgi:hypothetical protein